MQIQRNEISTLIVYPPPSIRGNITSCEVRIGTPAVQMPDAWSSATLSSLSTTLSADATRGTKVVSVVSVSGAVEGRKILLGNSHVAEIESISGLNLTLANPIPEDLGSGAVVKGLDIAVSISAEQAADAGNALALWKSDNGDIWTQTFQITHRQVSYQLDINLLRKLAPLSLRLLPSTDKDAKDAIDAAWENEIKSFLLSKGMKPENIISWDEISPWHAAAVVYHLLVNLHGADEAQIARWFSTMAKQRANALDSRRLWYSEDDALSTQPDNPVGRSRLSFRR